MTNTLPPNATAKIKKWLQTGSINLFGLPFAGKDTHGKQLADNLGGVLLGGGDIFRNTHMPPDIKALVDGGALMPIKDYLEMVLPYLAQKDFKGKPLILSAVGRWHGEEAGVLEATAEAGHPLLAVIFLKITEDVVRERWQAHHVLQDRGERADDTAEALETRLTEYRTKTLPVIEFYRDQGLLIEIDATPPVQDVSTEIVRQLVSIAEADR